MPFEFEHKRYPVTPGCYLMKDVRGRVIYVGKAKDLRKRLASYFNAGRKERRTRRLVERICDIEVILVNSEVESLILENNLIKRYKPRFNVLLKADDEGYPYIALTNEPFPRFVPFKKQRMNWALEGMGPGAVKRLFGPYPSWRFRTTLLDYVNETFLLRTCHPLPEYACLLLHMHKCSAPCEALITAEAYGLAVKRAVSFLSHPPALTVREMRARMWAHAERMEFERAARIREQITVMQRAMSLQLVERDVKHDQDVIWFGADGQALVLSYTCGTLLGVELVQTRDSRPQFLKDRYIRDVRDRDHAPGELIVNELSGPDSASGAEDLSALLGRLTGVALKITVPKSGVSMALLKLAERNYAYRISTLTQPV